MKLNIYKALTINYFDLKSRLFDRNRTGWPVPVQLLGRNLPFDFSDSGSSDFSGMSCISDIRSKFSFEKPGCKAVFEINQPFCQEAIAYGLLLH